MQCDCSYDNADQPEAYTQNTVRARKKHTCNECGSIIQPGELYERFTGIWNGIPATFKTCIPCVNMRDDLCPGGFMFGELGYQIQKCLGFNPYEASEEEQLCLIQ